ncbi:MAG: hypothetical protein M1824_001998, partial [Vezdaea acicularis]
MNSDKSPVLLMLNVPPKALCGIDLVSFTSSPQFKGVKNLPAGWHFVYTGTTTDLSVRTGTWFQVPTSAEQNTPREVYMKKWDAQKEELVSETDGAKVLEAKANLRMIWETGLSPYRQSAASVDTDDAVEEKHDWGKLTNCITQSLLQRITGGANNSYPFSTISSYKGDIDDIPGISDIKELQQPELHFIEMDQKATWRPGAVGRERTIDAQDRSWMLGHILSKLPQGTSAKEIIGEMQVTFLMVLTLNNYSCLEQWKRILVLFFNCKSAVKERASLFAHCFNTLRLQLQHCDDVQDGLFDLSDEGGSLLKRLIKIFRKGLEDEFGKGGGPSEVLETLEQLEEYLITRFGWQLSDSYVKRGMLELEDGEMVEME